MSEGQPKRHPPRDWWVRAFKVFSSGRQQIAPAALRCLKVSPNGIHLAIGECVYSKCLVLADNKLPPPHYGVWRSAQTAATSQLVSASIQSVQAVLAGKKLTPPHYDAWRSAQTAANLQLVSRCIRRTGYDRASVSKRAHNSSICKSSGSWRLPTVAAALHVVSNLSLVGQNRIFTPCMTVYMVISLPKIPYIHCTCMVLANPRHKSFGGKAILLYVFSCRAWWRKSIDLMQLQVGFGMNDSWCSYAMIHGALMQLQVGFGMNDSWCAYAMIHDALMQLQVGFKTNDSWCSYSTAGWLWNEWFMMLLCNDSWCSYATAGWLWNEWCMMLLCKVCYDSAQVMSKATYASTTWLRSHCWPWKWHMTERFLAWTTEQVCWHGAYL